MKYQVVLQFSTIHMNLDKLVELETLLEEKLKSNDVDGHDIGQEEMNIFILTNDPKKCFKTALSLIGVDVQVNLKAAYRKLDEDDYIVLFPKGLKKFDVL